jgi:hypothetical protein
MFGAGKESVWLGGDLAHDRLLFGTGYISSMDRLDTDQGDGER